MERFLIDDGIKQSKIVANRYKWSAENADMGSEDANELHADICNQYVKEYEQIAEWLEELKSYKDIGTLKELKELKENGTFTGLELTKLAIMQKELKEYKDLEEQGLLVRLPDDLNRVLYQVKYRWTECAEYSERNNECEIYNCKCECDSRKEYYIAEVDLRYIPIVSYCNCLGETVFLTSEEAEKKLEELKKA